MFQLRPYQKEALFGIEAAHKRGCNRQLVVKPTGTGKTILFAALAKQKNVRTLILAHRDELIKQAANKLKLFWKDVDVGIVKGDRNEPHAQVVIASIQTACRPARLEQLKQQDFQLVIVDEAHHAVSDSYKRVFTELGFTEGSDKLLVGVTATAKRGDGKPLGDVFDEIVFERSIKTMVQAGYLSDVRGISISTEIDLAHVEMRGGDFEETALAEVVNTEEMNDLVVKAYREHVDGQKAVVFTVNVAHAKALAEAFNGAGIVAKAIYGAMPQEDRETSLRAFSEGKITILTSCNVLTEGFDEPSIEAVLMARPTKSQSLYIQCVGRGLRLYPGKSHCTVIDFADTRYDVMQLATLTGKPIGEKSFKEAIEEEIEQEELALEVERQAGKAKVLHTEAFELFDKSVFAWIPLDGGHFKLPIERDEYIFLKNEPAGYRVGLSKSEGITMLSPLHLPLGYAQGVAEDEGRKRSRPLNRKNASWRNAPASEKQLNLLKIYRVEAPEGISKGEAADLIDRTKAQKEGLGFQAINKTGGQKHA